MLKSGVSEKEATQWLALQMQRGKIGTNLAFAAKKHGLEGERAKNFVSNCSYDAATEAVSHLKNRGFAIENGFSFDAETLTVCADGMAKGICTSLAFIDEYEQVGKNGGGMDIVKLLKMARNVASTVSDSKKREKVLLQNGISKESIYQFAKSLPALWKADNLGGFIRAVQSPTSIECQRLLDAATLAASQDKDDFVKKAVEEEGEKRGKRHGKNA